MKIVAWAKLGGIVCTEEGRPVQEEVDNLEAWSNRNGVEFSSANMRSCSEVLVTISAASWCSSLAGNIQ